MSDDKIKLSPKNQKLIPEMQLLGDRIQANLEFLAQVGVRPNTQSGKMTALLDMLVKKGIVNHDDIFEMELEFARQVDDEIGAAAAELRAEYERQKAMQGFMVPASAQQPKAGSQIIIPGQ